MTFVKYIIATFLVLFMVTGAYAFDKISIHKNIAKRELSPSVQTAVIFNDQLVPGVAAAAMGAGHWVNSNAFFIGDLAYDDGTTFDKATIALTMAYPPSATAANSNAITLTYEVSADGTNWVRPAVAPNTVGIFGGSAGFDAADGLQLGANPAACVGNESADGVVQITTYCPTNTFNTEITIDPASFIRFNAWNNTPAGKQMTIDLIGRAN